MVHLYCGILSVKKNEIINFTGNWKKLDNLTVRQVTQTQKGECCMLSLIFGSTGLIWITSYSSLMAVNNGTGSRNLEPGTEVKMMGEYWFLICFRTYIYHRTTCIVMLLLTMGRILLHQLATKKLNQKHVHNQILWIQLLNLSFNFPDVSSWQQKWAMTACSFPKVITAWKVFM